MRINTYRTLLQLVLFFGTILTVEAVKSEKLTPTSEEEIFLKWLSQYSSKKQMFIKDVWSANLDLPSKNKIPEYVALLCPNKKQERAQGVYIIQHRVKDYESREKWEVIFGLDEHTKVDCTPNKETGSIKLKFRKGPFLTLRQNYSDTDPGFESLDLAFRGDHNELVIVRGESQGTEDPASYTRVTDYANAKERCSYPTVEDGRIIKHLGHTNVIIDINHLDPVYPAGENPQYKLCETTKCTQAW